MSESSVFLEDRLQKEGEKVESYFQQFAQSGWDQEVYIAPAGILNNLEPSTEQSKNWRVREVLAHLVTTESGIVELIKEVACGGAGAPEGLDIDDYNQRKIIETQDCSFGALLGQFTTLRQGTIEMVSTFSESDLNQIGRHPFLGMVKIIEMIKLLYLHNQLHIRDLRRVIKEPCVPQGKFPAPKGEFTVS
jgi:hypothetical protein